ncbi:MAG: efflux RND transporter periplasmic adaptor subunit [Burkholderiales bacterium]|nr:efflux RND transporter periplasmic adaptor subunit [Burkholderiales bacterium]
MSFPKPGIHEHHSQGQVADLAARRAYEQAWARFAQQDSAEGFCASWLLIQCHAVGGVSDGVLLLLQPGAKSFVPVAFYPENPVDRAHLARITERTLQEGRGILEPQEPAGEQGQPRYQLAYPVRVDGEVKGVVAVEIDWRAEAQLQAAMRDLQWGSGWLEVLLRRHADPAQAERLRLKLALDLVATLVEPADLKQCAAAFATELAVRLGCDRVSLGLFRGARVEVRGVSHSPQFEPRANLLRAIEGAMEEAIDQAQTVVFPADAGGPPVVCRAHEALLRETGSGGVGSFPLMHDGEPVGALTLEKPPGGRLDAATLEVCEAVAAVAGPVVALRSAGESSLAAHAGRSTWNLWERLAGRGHAGFKLGAAALLAIALFLGLAAGEYRISANSTLEGAVMRAVSAPINGYVKEAGLRAGDTVKEGQVIGRFEDRELVLERAKLQSQYEQYSTQYRDALSQRDATQARIARAQMAQAEAQLALVEEQLERTRMSAPFDGVIVSGDLSQSLGAPVERGQVLFEIAPLHGFRVVLQVDERDIAHVAVGQEGELTVTSMPGERHRFTVTRVTPVNTAREGRNFFRVEARLDAAAAARLRPGMEGVGKIRIERRKLVWIWTHGFTDWVRLWAWSWLP